MNNNNILTSIKIMILYKSFVIIQLLLFVLSSSKTESIIIRCMEKEKQALVTFKEGLEDENGVLSSSSWLTTDDCCEWRGIVCSNDTNHVISLQLIPHDIMKSLKGNLDPSLLELKYLTYLDLSFFGSMITIPKFIGSLTRLKYLNLSSGFFHGEIPTEIGNLTNLQYLDLSKNYLTPRGLSATSLNWLSNLSSLKYLDLSGVNLSKVYNWAESINRLPFLIELKLSLCKLPAGIFSFSNISNSLSVIDFSFNDFAVEFSSFETLFNRSSSSLKYINLRSNDLYGEIYDDFGKMHSLEHLELTNNMLEGDITKSIGNITSLRFLDLSFSKKSIGTFPSNVLNLPRLETLLLPRNQIQGQLPLVFPSFSFSPITKLDLQFNKLSGSLPPSIGNLTRLTYLDLSYNSFTGLVTEVHFRNLSNLKFLSLSHNSLMALEFNLPDWFPPFNLTQLSLVNCKMGPHFPIWLQTQINLEVVEISGCGIQDVIPNWFQNNTFHSLHSLSIANNQIHGNLPRFSTKTSREFKLDLSSNQFQGTILSICNMDIDLAYLDLSNNNLSGTIPDCLLQFKYLRFLNLGNNNFSGNIPSLIGQLTHISSLNLRNNSLNGGLPTSLKQCTALRIIDVGNNKIMGEIPTYFGNNFYFLITLNLRSNKLQGDIPSSLCNLERLRVLDVSYNKISGTIPKCFGNFTSMAEKDGQGMAWDTSNPTMLSWKGLQLEFAYNLKYVKAIDLSSNRLSGEIPSEITFLVELVALNISRNNFHGKIPLEIGKLSNLQLLDFSRNQLNGTIPLSLSKLTFIGFLDLSYNNLSGRIPLSTQLQGFDASFYSGNVGLCGIPLPNLCPGDQRNSSVTTRDPQDEEEVEEETFNYSNFFAAMGIGFAFGLLGTLGCLLVNRSWRVTYFRFVSNIQSSVVVKIDKFKRFSCSMF